MVHMQFHRRSPLWSQTNQTNFSRLTHFCNGLTITQLYLSPGLLDWTLISILTFLIWYRPSLVFFLDIIWHSKMSTVFWSQAADCLFLQKYTMWWRNHQVHEERTFYLSVLSMCVHLARSFVLFIPLSLHLSLSLSLSPSLSLSSSFTLCVSCPWTLSLSLSLLPSLSVSLVPGLSLSRSLALSLCLQLKMRLKINLGGFIRFTFWPISPGLVPKHTNTHATTHTHSVHFQLWDEGRKELNYKNKRCVCVCVCVWCCILMISIRIPWGIINTQNEVFTHTHTHTHTRTHTVVL